MKLTDIRTYVVGNPPPHYGGRYFVFLKLMTEGNVHGVGEAYCLPFHPTIVARMLEDVFARYLEGEDPHNIESIWRRVYSAGYTQHPDLSLMAVLSALEMACWDIIGKEAGQPVYKLLGGRVHERLRSYTYILRVPAIRPTSTRIRCSRPSAPRSTWRRVSPRSSSTPPVRTAPSTGASSRSRRSSCASAL